MPGGEASLSSRVGWALLRHGGDNSGFDWAGWLGVDGKVIFLGWKVNS